VIRRNTPPVLAMTNIVTQGTDKHRRPIPPASATI
jgi:hypothetical protein